MTIYLPMQMLFYNSIFFVAFKATIFYIAYNIIVMQREKKDTYSKKKILVKLEKVN